MYITDTRLYIASCKYRVKQYDTAAVYMICADKLAGVRTPTTIIK